MEKSKRHIKTDNKQNKTNLFYQMRLVMRNYAFAPNFPFVVCKWNGKSLVAMKTAEAKNTNGNQ